VIAGSVFGKTGLAVTGLYAPFFFLAAFFGTIVAGGSSALAAKYIAQDDNCRVNEIYTLAMILSAVCASALLITGMLFRSPILTLITGGGELLEPASRYYIPALLCTSLTVVIFMPLFWARLMGRPSVALILTVVLAGASIALGALYTFGIGMGLEGLAYAQALATALALAVSLYGLHLPKTGLCMCRPGRIREDTAALAALGSPQGLSRLYRFLSLFLLNIIMLYVGGPEAVAVFSVLNMLLRFVTAIANGISGVQIPVAGVLNEERDMLSLRQLSRVMFIFGNALIFAVAVLMLIFNQAIAAVFAVRYPVFFSVMVCFCIYIIFYINGNLFVSWYTAIRKVKLANIVTLTQDMIFPPLLALLFALPGGNTIWLYLPAVGFLTGLLLMVIRHRCKSDTDPDSVALAFSVERDATMAGHASAAVSDFCEEQGFAAKTTMLLSMAIEELIVLMSEQNAGSGDISVRLLRFDGGTVLRLRDAGRKFNPLDYYKNRLTDDIEDSIGLMGIKYITEAAEVVYYRETFGVNNLVVII
jgi:Na+-driven multidrug efflux pump